QLKNSANILLLAASRLNDIVNNEKTFWNEMLSLRERHWSLRRGDKEKNIGQQIFVHYGYADVGSIHGDISKAQILRSPDEKQVAVSLPQKPKKAVKLRLQQRSNSLLTVEPCVQENL
ncbi:10586_t:CDS:2, partial [Gigaspora rosea]